MIDYRKIWENCIPPEVTKTVVAANPYEVVYKNLVEQALLIAKLQGIKIEIPKEWLL